jgi:hypothetical protein
MAKLDLKKGLRDLYDAPKDPVLVTVPPMNFLLVDGEGDPRDSIAYIQAIEVLYGLSYTIKFMLKKEAGIDYGVLPLEGLWWSEDMDAFLLGERNKWKWTAMIMQPEMVLAEQVERAKVELKRRKDPPALPKVRLERYDEGLSAQSMHLGPYSEERPTIERLHRFIEEQGCERTGRHHEIYLGDPRRAKPEKLRTIIRQPVRRLG